MADKTIGELTRVVWNESNPQSSIQPEDLFVLEQSGTAKALTGQILVNWLTLYADGHGGIQSITWQTSGIAGNGQLHTATIHYADGSTSTFAVRDGYKGDTGDAWHVYIKYSANQPAQDSDMGDAPDDWMGIYSGTAATAPTSYNDYAWFNIKGQIGNPAILNSGVVEYQIGTTGTVPPSGEWATDIPIVPPGNWLWTRTTLTFNSGSPVYIYSAARQGIDGSGSPSTTVPLPDISGGAVGESNTFARADHQHPSSLLVVSANLTALPTSISNANITADMRVVSISYGTPSAITSAVAWSTAAGSLTLSGTMTGSTSATIILAII